ncbi:Phosphomannomutase [Labilithrix luteola]|uniref:Phosphomannomutase n=1 Tax=Labilithrix luteola TaxID=1391654 RepID=A0A0K1PTM3_9BACT|nr:phosphomannomutase/phosphoglucomutase [Labilithrix luteola]AKU96484.1 Phosphomannomutase [Labilithrix luteola]
MTVPAHIFREYDIRGVADRDLSDGLAENIGRGLAHMLRSKNGGAPRLAVGRDCRLSSERLFASLVRGLTKHGVEVVEIGVGPTPMLYFAVHHLGTDGGIQITGSHNPGDENGFKIMRGKASFYGADIQKLKAMIIEGKWETETTGKVETIDVQEPYVAAMKERFDFSSSDVKFVVDAGNGAGGPLGLKTMRALGLSPDPLFCEMDGNFPNHHPDPTVPKNLAALIARVKETGARVGLAYDGDADRLGAVDESGEIIWGDKLMILFSRALLADKPGSTILGEVKCSQTLYDDIAKHGGNPVVWKTGHSLIKTKMKETGALLAGEMSGHLFFADRYFGFDDAIYAGLRLLEILAKDGRPLSAMLADVPKTFTTPEMRVDCPDALKFQVVEAVTRRYKEKGYPVLDIDGARITFPAKGSAPTWGLVRSSNTGPILVMRFEAGSEAELDAIRAEVEGVVAEERAKLSH